MKILFFFFQIDITWNYIWSKINVLDYPKSCFLVIYAKKCSLAKITCEMISEATLTWNEEGIYKNDNINVKNVQTNTVDKLFYKYISILYHCIAMRCAIICVTFSHICIQGVIGTGRVQVNVAVLRNLIVAHNAPLFSLKKHTCKM